MAAYYTGPGEFGSVVKAIVARWNGVVVARSADSIVLEGNHYFPPDSLNDDYFVDAETTTHCPWKGVASYKTIIVDGEVNEDACWYYADPTSQASRIRGHFAFWRGVDIEVTDDELDPVLAALPADVVRKLAFFNFYNSTTASFFADPGQVIQQVNPTFRWTFDVVEEPIGLELFQLLEQVGMSPADAAKWREMLLSHGWVKIPEIRAQLKSEVRYFSLDAVISRHSQLEQLTGLQGQFADITREVQLTQRREQLTTDLESNLEGVINNISDGILVTDPSGLVQLANPALRSMYGIGDPTGEPASAIGGDLAALLARRRETRRSDLGIEAEINLPRKRTGKAINNPIYAVNKASGEAVGRGSVTVIRDITFEKQVDRMKTEFIANVSHELRTPLTSILGFANIINRRLRRLFPQIESTDKNRDLMNQVTSNLRIIVSEGGRLTQIINDVLDIAKMEAGKIDWKYEGIGVADIAEKAVEATRGLFHDSDVELRLHLDGAFPVLKGDRGRLIQVLVNLISNAAKFTTSGQVTVAARVGFDRVEFSVTDTGAGISPQDIATVFEKFKQVGDSLTEKPVGTGLGLALCKYVVEHHRGDIWVESERGRGSVFTFCLPIDEADAITAEGTVRVFDTHHLLHQLESALSEVEDPQTSEERGKTVMVVDDDNSIRELLRQELELAGYAVTEAADGIAAIRGIKSSKPDLVVLDIMMPEMGGFDVAAVLRNDPETSHIPIIVHSVVEDEERGYRIGVDRYFRKSGNIGEIVRCVKGLLSVGSSPKRVLVVDEDQTTAESLSQLLKARGYHVTGVTTHDGWRDAAKKHRPDMLIVDALFPKREELIQAMRFDSVLNDTYVIVLGETLDD